MLYYMRARWYEPRSGRFLTEDPAGLAGGLNPYIFAGADPINGADPSGMRPCEPGEDGHWDGAGGHWDGDNWFERREWHHCGSNLPYDPSSMQRPRDCRDYVFGGVGDCEVPYVPPPLPRPARGHDDDECAKAKLAAVVTGASDLVTLGSLGVAGYWAVAARSRHAASAGWAAVKWFKTAIRTHRTYRAARGLAVGWAMGATDSELAGAFGVTGNGVMTQSDVNWRDYVPVLGTIRAIQLAQRACQ